MHYNMPESKSVLNQVWIGIVLGLILPIVTFGIMYRYTYRGNKSLAEFIETMIMLDSLSTMVAICCLSNLAVFAYCSHVNVLKLTRGIMLSTLFYGFVIIVLKFGIQ